MGITETLARDNGALEVKSGMDWLTVGGINNWSPSPTVNKADTTKFSNEGRASNMNASTADSFTFTGFRQVDEATGDRDPGQIACEVLSRVLGPESRGEFRHSRAGGKVTTYFATVTVTDGGGGNDDPDAWEVELEVDGDFTTTTDADVPDVVTTPVGTGGTGTVSVTWTNGAEVGDYYEVTVFNGSTVLKVAYSTEKPVLVTGLATGTGRTAKVRARNDAGWSAQSAASATFSIS